MVRLLEEEGHRVVIFDNLSTGHRSAVPKTVDFVEGDLRNVSDLKRLFKKYPVDAVMHFAACALVGESVENPIKYFDNNVGGSMNLLKVMHDHDVHRLIFSSTCAIYGAVQKIPIDEREPKYPANPYGHSKWTVERLMDGFARTGKLRYVALRYFNACGAHRNGGLGETHIPETHLIPNVLKFACGKTKRLEVFGDDYDTPDGTCVRDYVHVEDIVRAHLLALRYLMKEKGCEAFNLGSQKGYSVMEIIRAVEEVAGKKLKPVISPRRPGDPPRLIANSSKIRKLLGWSAEIGLSEIIRSAWEWERSSRY
jgi:UDP-glucose 4-epimerase